MPFIRGRYHINPAMGEAMEAAREAEAALQALEHIARQKNGDAEDDSSESRTASRGPIHRVEIEAAEMVPSHSGRAQRGYAMRLHRMPPATTADGDSDFGVEGKTATPTGQSDTHIFSNHHDLLDFLGDELSKDSSR